MAEHGILKDTIFQLIPKWEKEIRQCSERILTERVERSAGAKYPNESAGTKVPKDLELDGRDADTMIGTQQSGRVLLGTYCATIEVDWTGRNHQNGKVFRSFPNVSGDNWPLLDFSDKNRNSR